MLRPFLSLSFPYHDTASEIKVRVLESPVCQDTLVDIDKQPCYCKFCSTARPQSEHSLTMALDEKTEPSIVEEKETAGDFASYLVSVIMLVISNV